MSPTPRFTVALGWATAGVLLTLFVASCSSSNGGSDAPGSDGASAVHDTRLDTATDATTPPDAVASGPDTPSDAPAQDLVLPEGLHGDPAPERLPLPEFAAVVDSTGSPVGPSDLRGSPTVMWFYPLASSSG